MFSKSQNQWRKGLLQSESEAQVWKGQLLSEMCQLLTRVDLFAILQSCTTRSQNILGQLGRKIQANSFSKWLARITAKKLCIPSFLKPGRSWWKGRIGQKWKNGQIPKGIICMLSLIRHGPKIFLEPLVNWTMQNAKKTAIVHSCRLQQTDSWWQCSLFHSKFFSFSFSSFLSFSFSLFHIFSSIIWENTSIQLHTHTLNSCNIL